MMNRVNWEYAVIGSREALLARVAWNIGQRLPTELHSIADQLGFTAEEIALYDVGELSDDLTIDNNETYLRGAIVMPDENGLPAALFGKPLLKERFRFEPSSKPRISMGVN